MKASARANLAPAIANVVQNGVVEKFRLLRHEGNAAPQVFYRRITERHAVEQHLALLRIIEAAQQINDGTFSAAIWAHNCQVVAPCDRQV